MKISKIIAAAATASLAAACSTTGDAPKGPDFDGLEADVLVEAVYRSDNAAGAGNYVLVISNARPAADGAPVAVGDFQMQLDLYNAADDDPVNAALPVGTYEAGSDRSPFTWNPQHSVLAIRTDEGADGVTYSPMLAGRVEVARRGMDYTVAACMTLLGGEEIDVRYTGPIPFVQGGTSSYERFRTPQNIAFGSMQGRFYANWFYPHADDMSVELFDGTFDADGNLVDGYYMTLPVYMPKTADPENSAEPRFVEGTYRIADTPGSSINNIPYTITCGAMIDVFGIVAPTGAYLTHIDERTGKRTLGLLEQGTVEVVRTADGYSVAVDLATAEGVSIKGSYGGTMNVRNFCDNRNMPARPWSTLTEDHTLVLPETTVAIAYFMGEELVPGQESWAIYVMDAEGDTVITEIMVAAGAGTTLPVGTFDVSPSLAAGTAIPGFRGFGGSDLYYTWYGDLGSTDSDGVQTRLAPIVGGSLTISQVGGQYAFAFALVDDAGNEIVGQWTGDVDMYDSLQRTAPQPADRMFRRVRTRE